MSISPPSDIVLDVVRAADPVRAGQAAARLTRARPADAAAFASLMDDGADASSTLPPDVALAATGPAPQKRPANSAEAFQQFEAMTLATMIESAMPADDSGVYGSGTAGSVWKSMMAEQLGKQMAKAGGIGLAAQLERSAAATHYGRGNTSTADPGTQARSLIISNLERGALQDIRPGADTDIAADSLFQDDT